MSTTEQNQTVPQETAFTGYAMFSARVPGKPAQGRYVHFDNIADCLEPTSASEELSILASDARKLSSDSTKAEGIVMQISGTSAAAKFEISLGAGIDYSGQGAMLPDADQQEQIFQVTLEPASQSAATLAMKFTGGFDCPDAWQLPNKATVAQPVADRESALSQLCGVRLRSRDSA